MLIKDLPLNNNISIPSLGLGTWQLEGDTAQMAVEEALKIGYRHIDTADAYGNHKNIAIALKNSHVKRSDLYITTKVWHSHLDSQGILDSANRFLDELETDYLDLLLIHWPNSNNSIEESLNAMNSLVDKGIVKSIGVSNFTIHHIQDILDKGYKVSNNQVELHPSFSQPELREFCDKNNIVVTAYSPIAQGKDLNLKIIQDLSLKYNRSTSQVILNWIISHKMVAIPRSSKVEHIEDNYKTLEWQLSDEDIALIDTLNENNRLINPPFAEFNY